MTSIHRIDAPPMSGEDDLQAVAATVAAISRNMATVVEGKTEVIRLALITLLAEGHLLIEDVPGVGKTLLAKALARSVDCSVARVQFTPDLLPSDITGVSVYSPDTGTFEFRPGPIFANIVIGDEINRAGPKTQSALLESMEEHTVTIDGATHELGRPFMVIATQNPIELEGTYPLPEAQRDRFLMRVTVGYPDAAHELAVLRTHGGPDRLATLGAVTDAATVARASVAVHAVHTTPSLEQYIIALCRATRVHPDVELGVSPRAALGLLRAARAAAAIDGRGAVLPDDVKAMARHVLPHRVLLSADARLAGRDSAEVIDDILDRRPVPTQ